MRTPWQRGDGSVHSANGHGAHRANGVRPEGLETESVAFNELDAAPMDLAALHADEELIRALAAGRSAPSSGSAYTDDRLVGMLQAWRAEVDAEPVRPLITVEQASAAIRKSRVAGRRRLLVPVASAAAVLAVLLSGLVIGAHDAQPGDPLWAMSKVLYQERAASVEAAVDVETKLKKAREAMAEGRTEDARNELDAIASGLDEVRSEEGKEALVSQQQFLAAKLESAPPGQPIDVNDTAASPSVSPSSSKVKPPRPSSSVPTPTTTTPVPDPPSAPPQSSGGPGDSGIAPN